MKKHSKRNLTYAMALGRSMTAVMDPPSANEATTPANLQTALGVESHAHARYLEFAKEADEEGYAPVASLFRAAARAEEIHLGNLREVLNGLGLPSAENSDPVVVKSTFENLHAAIRDEVYERDEMYPSFLFQARSEGNRAAARAFHLAQTAESEHADLFSQSLRELERLRGDALVHHVCPVCGLTLADADRSRCTVCSTPIDQFEKVS
jgi:rubrerythrin